VNFINLSSRCQFHQHFTRAFLTAASCPKKDFYTPPTPTPNPQKRATDFCTAYLKIVQLLYCVLKKVRQKAGPKKSAKKTAKKTHQKSTLPYTQQYANHQKKILLKAYS
jgi:hypothetical protein